MARLASSTHCAEATIDGDDGGLRGGSVCGGVGGGFTVLLGGGGGGGCTALGAHPHSATSIIRLSTAYRHDICTCPLKRHLPGLSHDLALLPRAVERAQTSGLGPLDEELCDTRWTLCSGNPATRRVHRHLHDTRGR